MTPEILHGIIRTAARIARDGRVEEFCPETVWISRFPDRLSANEITHIAFCSQCQAALQIHHSGDLFRERQPTPDLKSLLSRITRSARWEQIKDTIAQWLNRPTIWLPDPAFAFARLPDDSPAGLALTVFEIDLTPWKLSSEGLRIDRYAPTDDPNVMQLTISGFDPNIVGRDARVGLCPRDTILKVCRQEPLPIPPNLEKIECILQKIFSGRAAGTTPKMNQIGSESIWIEGRIDSESSDRRVLSLNLPARAADYFVRGELWAVLIVG